MNHLYTYPNMFQENITYLPINWDGSDLIEIVENIFSNKPFFNEIRRNAWNEFEKSYEEMEEMVKLSEYIKHI